MVALDSVSRIAEILVVSGASVAVGVTAALALLWMRRDTEKTIRRATATALEEARAVADEALSRSEEAMETAWEVRSSHTAEA